MRAAIDWSVSLLPELAARPARGPRRLRDAVHLEAVEAVGAGRSWDGEGIDALAASSTPRWSSRPRSTGGRRSRCSRSCASTRSERLEGARRGSSDAQRPRRLLRRLRAARLPGLRGPGQVDAVAELGLELPNLRAAVRHLVHTDRLDDAGDFAWSLLIYWWISGFFSEVRLWMLELLDKAAADHGPHPRRRRFFALWGEMWRRPVRQVDRRARRVRAPVHRERRRGCRGDGARRARRRTRCSSPTSTWRPRRPSCSEAVGALHALGNGWGEAMTEVGARTPRAWRAARSRSRSRISTRGIDDRRSGAGPVHRASSPGNNVARLMLPRAATSRPPRQRVRHDPVAVGPPALRRGRAVRIRGAERHRRRPRRRMAGGCARRRRGRRSGSASASSTSKASRSHVQPLAALRDERPRGRRRRRARRRRP